MAKKLLVADLLCGAGGSSTGCAQALAEMGREMELVCVNHWDVAIDTHQRNHRDARHYVQDIATVRPHILVPEGYLDLLMASPTCTHHSNARGGKPTSDQQRSDPWHIITWLTELRVKRLIIENVWEFVKWGPVDHRTGKPIKSREGEYFMAWIQTLQRLGFDPEWRKLNAADFGDATTRSRFILMARSDRKRVVWPMPTHQNPKKMDGDLFAAAHPWKPARDIIDWNKKGRSIYNRKKPLADKTLARIFAGAVRHKWPEPYIVVLRNHMISQGMDVPLPVIAANGQHLAIVEPIILSQSSTGAARTTASPLPTIMTGGAGAEHRQGCARPMLVEPFVLSQASGGAARSVIYPIPTQTTGGKGASHALISPYYGSGSGETCTHVDESLPTITAKGRFGMVVPVTNSNGGPQARDVETDPLPTLTTAKGGEFAIVDIECNSGEERMDLRYDILFRMLEPHELAEAMGFSGYEFAGTKTQIIKQIGNAVSVKKMKACVGSIMADAAPKNRIATDFKEAAE